ncbi:MAG: hypothetical protein K9M99_04270 [Candidatus Cloacimonetes bacterium]|nr:hypothetical protein [Candidatus Cloacimonadota bacterium]
MYYSKILADLKKQDRNPVNKMYLSELSLKWKNFQQLTENPASANADLAKALSKFLTVLHNRKFLYNKVKNNGFHEDSPIYSANYMNDLIAALMIRQPLTIQPGITWDFQPLNYKLAISGKNPAEIAAAPLVGSQETPPVLSLALNLDFQYRVSGKRNFTKGNFKLPFLLFFPIKNPTMADLFLLEHYAMQVKSTCHTAQVFLVCESLENCKEANFQDLNFKIFALLTESESNPYQISIQLIDKLDTAIKNVLYHSPESQLVIVKEKKKAAPAHPVPKTKTRHNRYKKK